MNKVLFVLYILFFISSITIASGNGNIKEMVMDIVSGEFWIILISGEIAIVGLTLKNTLVSSELIHLKDIPMSQNNFS